MIKPLPERVVLSAADVKLTQGTEAWFEMVGDLICEAIAQSGFPSELNLSLIESYTDGTALPGGQFQGLRLDIVDGTPSFRVGVLPDEMADVIIEVSADAARVLNTLRSDDPRYPAAIINYLNSNEMQIAGDLSVLEPVFAAIHDNIVQRTT